TALLAARGREHAASAHRPRWTVRHLPHEIPNGEEGAGTEAEHHAEAGERERARRREEASDVAPERQHGACAHREPPEAARDQPPARRPAHGELAAEQRGGQPAEEHAQIQQRAGIEPRHDEIGAPYDADAGQHPVTPVPHAVRRRPRTIEREEEDVDHRDEERGRPHRPRLSEDEPILRAEQTGHRAGFYRETTSRFQNYCAEITGKARCRGSGNGEVWRGPWRPPPIS